MLQLYHYIIYVLVYWDLEYPEKHMGDSVFDVYDNKPLKKTIQECYDSGLNVPNCCGEVNQKHIFPRV